MVGHISLMQVLTLGECNVCAAERLRFIGEEQQQWHSREEFGEVSGDLVRRLHGWSAHCIL